MSKLVLPYYSGQDRERKQLADLSSWLNWSLTEKPQTQVPSSLKGSCARESRARMASLIHVYSENISENIETMIAAILTTSNTLTPMLTCLCVPLIFPAHQATILLASHAQQP